MGSARLVAIDRETVAVTNTAGGLTAAKIRPGSGAQVHFAQITVETAQLRYTVEGTTATTSIGHIGDIGDVIEVWGGSDMDNFSAIRTGSTSASLQVTYFGVAG